MLMDEEIADKLKNVNIGGENKGNEPVAPTSSTKLNQPEQTQDWQKCTGYRTKVSFDSDYSMKDLAAVKSPKLTLME